MANGVELMCSCFVCSLSLPPAAPKPTPSEHLQQLTLTHMPHYTDNWREAPLHTNLHIKTKVSWGKSSHSQLLLLNPRLSYQLQTVP